MDQPHPDARVRKPGLKGAWIALGARLLPIWLPVQRFFGRTVFSTLTRRIIALNLAGLLILVVGILYLNQWRAGLIEARVQSLRVQGEIIAAAVAASATVDSDVIRVDPDRLIELSTGDAISPLSFFDPNLEFPINPERVAPLLGRRRWLALAFVLFASTASAQTPYQVLTDPEPYVPLGPGAIEMVPGLGDGQTEPIQLPFR